MKIVVAGGTGFIGEPLVNALVADEHEITVVSRDPENALEIMAPEVSVVDYDNLPEAADAVINLAGEPLMGYWTSVKKHRIRSSRIRTTRLLVDWMLGMEQRPSVFINASSVAIYGDRPGEVLSEESAYDPQEKYLAEVCRRWEDEARRLEGSDVRVVMMRFGHVLDPSGGYMATILQALRRFPCFLIGTDEAIFPWISLPDAIGVTKFALQSDIAGPVNAVAAHAVQHTEFLSQIAHKLGKSIWGTLPNWALSLGMGEFSQLLLESQHVVPLKLTEAGFRFRYSTIEQCLSRLARYRLEERFIQSA